jgi:hypothetical protein
MSRLLFLSISIALMAISVHAQEYSLRVPDTEEYLATVTALLGDIPEDSRYDDPNRALMESVQYELENRDWDFDDVSFYVLRDAYPLLPIAPYTQNNNFDVWQERLIFAWLRENEIDLASESELQFDQHTIRVTSVDFNGDERDEYILDIEVIRQDGYTDFAAYWVLERDDSRGFGYRRVKTPWRGLVPTAALQRDVVVKAKYCILKT